MRHPSFSAAAVVVQAGKAGAGEGNGFRLPPLQRDIRGAVRRVGVEVEFTGLSARAAAHALAAGLGGACHEEDAHAFHIPDSAIGTLAVELDIRYAHPQRAKATPRWRLGAVGAAWLGTVLSPMVPCELVTAPLPLDQLSGVDRAVALLRAAGARGDGATWFGSLGLHFNVAPASLDSMTVTAVLKALLLRNHRLRHEVAGTGDAYLPDAYPAEYVRRVVDPGYWPDLRTLGEDYLNANPTRNRDLDLLPLLLHLDADMVRARLPYEKIGSRPVFHYRLPRAHVSDPAWSVATAWNGWVTVEELAADRDRLDALGRAAA